jgi:hypothetical protein
VRGANEATTFETDKDLTIEGSNYRQEHIFFVIPSEKECMSSLTKETNYGVLESIKEKIN